MDAISFHNVAVLMNFVFLAAWIRLGYSLEPVVLFRVFSRSFSVHLFWLMNIYLLQTLLEKVVKVKVAKPSTAGILSFESKMTNAFAFCEMTNPCWNCLWNIEQTWFSLCLTRMILCLVFSSQAGTYKTVFDFCSGKCRHNSESVVSYWLFLFLLKRIFVGEVSWDYVM